MDNEQNAETAVASSGLLALVVWLSKYQEDLNDLRNELMQMPAEECREALVMKWPIVQGTMNQIRLKRISEMPFDAKLAREAIEALSAKALSDNVPLTVGQSPKGGSPC